MLGGLNGLKTLNNSATLRFARVVGAPPSAHGCSRRALLAVPLEPEARHRRAVPSVCQRFPAHL